jgi:hypothetical protein
MSLDHKYEIGDEVVIVMATSNHNFKIGDVGRVVDTRVRKERHYLIKTESKVRWVRKEDIFPLNELYYINGSVHGAFIDEEKLMLRGFKEAK